MCGRSLISPRRKTASSRLLYIRAYRVSPSRPRMRWSGLSIGYAKVGATVNRQGRFGGAMISCPFEYHLTDAEIKKLGELSLTWSHTDHTIGNSLKAALDFTDDEAIRLIFPLSLENRVRWLRGIKARLNGGAQMALNEFVLLLPALQAVKNQVIHGVIIPDVTEGPIFHLRSKDRTFTKDDLFACEEFTNYCARVAYCLRMSLFWGDGSQTTLPDRPHIPRALGPYIQRGKKAGRRPPSRHRSSPP